MVQIDALDLGNFIRFREKRPILSMNTPHWQHWRVCCIGDPTGRILGMIVPMDSVVQSSVPQILVQIDALDLGNFIRFREKRPILSMNTPHWQHWRVCCIGDPTGRILGMIVPMDSVVQSSVPQILVQIDALDLGNFIRFHEKIPILSMNTPPWQRWHTTSRTRAGGRKWQ